MFIISILFQILLAWLLADFITGLVHWFEDKYLDHDKTLNFLTSIAEDNDLHHKKPTAMTQSSGWTNMKSGFVVGTPVAIIAWFLGAPLWFWLACFFSGFGNLIHRWSHIPERKLNPLIRGMQKVGLFISHAHHDSHHRSMAKLIPKHLSGYRFCPMTDWVNPILDYFKFWTRLEWLLSKFGLHTIEKLKQQQQ